MTLKHRLNLIPLFFLKIEVKFQKWKKIRKNWYKDSCMWVNWHLFLFTSLTQLTIHGNKKIAFFSCQKLILTLRLYFLYELSHCTIILCQYVLKNALRSWVYCEVYWRTHNERLIWKEFKRKSKSTYVKK